MSVPSPLRSAVTRRAPGRALATVASVTAAAWLAACGGESTNLELEWATHVRPKGDTTATAPTTPTVVQPGPPAALALSRTDTTLLVGARLVVGAVVRDSAGRPLDEPPVAWASSDTTVLAVEGQGGVRELRAARPGTATVTVTLGALRQALRVVVAPIPPRPVAAVSLAGDSVIALGDSVLVRLTARDASGQPLTLADRVVAWYTDLGGSVPLVLGAPVGASDTARAAARWVHGAAVGTGRVGVSVDGQGTTALFRVVGPAPRPVARVARVVLAVGETTLAVGAAASVTATAVDSLGRPVVEADLRLQSANPAAGIVSQDSVGTGARAGTVYGTLRALSPATFSVTAETRDRSAFAQAVVTVIRAATP